ncbi:hypothetical protein L1987_31206 [Smallanthus sonchifolius]|uniref:Uncharacterized protein n=1 Tax=Smallanthus sonchifolius TaxID=185202 RepID=A0ACB9I659_9ASTR|nr:hypothetical protein L1987_31206 [Smallanthus sonchifolius]
MFKWFLRLGFALFLVSQHGFVSYVDIIHLKKVVFCKSWNFFVFGVVGFYRLLVDFLGDCGIISRCEQDNFMVLDPKYQRN